MGAGCTSACRAPIAMSGSFFSRAIVSAFRCAAWWLQHRRTMPHAGMSRGPCVAPPFSRAPGCVAWVAARLAACCALRASISALRRAQHAAARRAFSGARMRCWSVPCRAAVGRFRGAACAKGSSTTAAAAVRRCLPPVARCGGPLEVSGQDEPRARKQRLDRLGVHLRRRAAVGSSALPSRALPAASGALHVASCTLQAVRRMLHVACCNLDVERCT